MNNLKPSALGSGRGRGRPSIGRPVTARLSIEDHAFILALGDEGDALGVRRAVKIVAGMGLEEARRRVQEIEGPPEPIKVPGKRGRPRTTPKPDLTNAFNEPQDALPDTLTGEDELGVRHGT